jgi:hypothetical protein
MKRVTRKRWIAAAAASGAMAAAMPGCGAAYADSAADGTATNSPGLLSGNGVQLPVHLPVDACGNTVNVVGLLNPATGNACTNTGHGGATTHTHARVEHAPGVVSGNGVRLPVELPVNLSGNSVNVVGVGNPVVGNTSTNTGGEPPSRPEHPAPHPSQPTKPPAPPKARTPEHPPHHHPAVTHPQASLAHTGADGTLPALATGAALLLGGTALYRRHRPGRAS